MPNQTTNSGSYKNSWRILFKHLKEYKPLILSLAALGLISAAANGTIPLIVGLFLDALLHLSKTIVINGFEIPNWVAMLLLWVSVQLAANIIDWIINRKGRVLRTAVQLGYQSKAFSHLLFLPLSFHKDAKIGAMADSLSKTSWEMSSIAQDILVNLTPPILSVFVGIVVTYLINPIFTGVLLVGVLVYGVMVMKLSIPTTHLLNDGHTAWNEAYTDALQAVTNIQSVKHMATEIYEKEKIEQSYFGRALKIWSDLHMVWSNVNFYQRMIVLATQATIFFLSVYFIREGNLTIGQLVALNGYAGLLLGPFVILGHQWQTLQNGLVSIRQTEAQIFEVKSENYHPKNAYAPAAIRGDVSFENVSFGYDESALVLHDMSFSVRQGESVAFVGKSGVGKSTVIDLISAYYFPTQGTVSVDGIDTRKFDLAVLRNGIAVVPQEPVLFNDTIMMNIRYGKLSASDEEVYEAAKKAHASEFIEKLPSQYDQVVGERGMKLSVGQKQRIAIARAILRDPAILILDEPTSALDAETEQLISKSFEELMKGRTTFIVAHRLSTVRKADRIFVFDEGRIVEEGKHEDLIKRESGLYKRLHEYQAGL